MKTQKQAIAWAKSQKGKGIDYDGYYGYQCMDLAAAYIMYVTDNKYRTWGNAIDAMPLVPVPSTLLQAFGQVFMFASRALQLTLCVTGAICVGGWVMVLLYGLFCAQVGCILLCAQRHRISYAPQIHMYFSGYPNDMSKLKALVVAVW